MPDFHFHPPVITHRSLQNAMSLPSFNIAEYPGQLVEKVSQFKDAFAPFAAKADELLKARYWSNATWREREKILDTVSWLLRVHAPR